MKKLILGAASLLIATCAAWADPSGTYDVKGTRPDGTTYEGQLEIAKIGDVYELNYTYSDSSEQQGSAIGDDSFLAYGYGDEQELGVGLMASKGGNWEGVWTNAGSDKMGLESWTKK